MVLCGGGAGMCGVCGVSEGQWRCKHTPALLLVKVDEPTVRLTLLSAKMAPPQFCHHVIPQNTMAVSNLTARPVRTSSGGRTPHARL